MNTEAWNELAELEKQAASILVGPGTARPHPYVSRRRAAASSEVAPAPLVPAQRLLALRHKAAEVEAIKRALFQQDAAPFRRLDFTKVEVDVWLKAARAGKLIVASLDAGAESFRVTINTMGRAELRKADSKKKPTRQ